MAFLKKQVKGILKEDGFFVGFEKDQVYDFTIDYNDKNDMCRITLNGKNRSDNFICPKGFIPTFIKILENPAADILFNKTE